MRGVLPLVAAIAVAPAAVAGQCDYRLLQPLRFTDGAVGGCVNRTDIPALLARKVTVGATDAYEFLAAKNGRRVRTENCGQYTAAVRRGAEAATTFDITMEGFFIRTCGALHALAAVKPARTSHLDGARLLDPQRLPVVLLPFVSPGEARDLYAASVAQRSIGDLAPGRAVLKEPAPHALIVDYDGMRRHYDAIARGDFDGDGIEDLLVSAATHALGGSFRSYDIFLMTRRDPGQRLYGVLGGSMRCAYDGSRYACAQERGWQPF